jgi:putative protease
MKKPELLSPAGTLNNMRYALAYGGDAVYAGQPRYSLRVRNNDFQLDNLQIGIEEAHANGKKFYVASNLLPHNNKLTYYLEHMAPVIDMNPDALIMADPGLIMMVREKWPEMAIHLSVQANTMNWAAVKFWKSIGIRRIILSRELSLEEVEEIRQQCPDIELEVFVHGALCVAYSGRCLLSGYFNHRDANQGNCTNSCRWEYDLQGAIEDVSGDIIPNLLADKVYTLTEKSRPNEQMPIFEDEHGTYIMNSKDLRAVQHIDRLVKIGVDSLKIEGRTKSHYYAARTTQVYRQAIDDAVAGRPFDTSLMQRLDVLAHRGYTDGFYTRKSKSVNQNYETGRSVISGQRFVGEIISYDAGSAEAVVVVKNKFAVGSQAELICPSGNQSFIIKAIYDDRSGDAMETVPGSGYQVKIQLPKDPGRYGLLAVTLV